MRSGYDDIRTKFYTGQVDMQYAISQQHAEMGPRASSDTDERLQVQLLGLRHLIWPVLFPFEHSRERRFILQYGGCIYKERNEKIKK